MSSAALLDQTEHRPAQTRVIDAALALFAEHGVSGTSLQMIADSLGVTKAAVYHQFRTKDEIVVAAASKPLALVEAAVLAAEAEEVPDRALRILLGAIVDIAVRQRHRLSRLSDDPVMRKFIDEYPPFRALLERQYRILSRGDGSIRSRVRAVATMSVVGATASQQGIADISDEALHAELRALVNDIYFGNWPASGSSDAPRALPI